MNAQELFLDVSSGRFLDGESTIPTNKPTFYSDEVRSTKINLRKVNNNKLSSVTGSLGSSLKVRLGTSTAKLADGVIPGASTLPLIKATATIVTLGSAQASAIGSVITFTAVTATITAGISTNSVVSKTPEFGTFLTSATTRLAQFSANIQVVTAVTATAKTLVNLPALVTPTITASIASSVVPTASFNIQNINAFNIVDTPLDLTILPINPVTFSAVLNTPIAATFTSTMTGGSVTTIAISGIGNGYLDGTYSLTFVGASTTSARANAVALGGKIASVSLINGGSGYSANPSVTLFTPDKAVLSILPSNYIGKIDGKDSFTWIAPTTTTARADLLFTDPTSSSIVTGLSVPSAFISFYAPSISGNPTWQITVVCGGYGYITAPTISRDSFLVNAQSVVRSVNTTSAGLAYTGYQFETVQDGKVTITARIEGLGLKTISINESLSTKPVALEEGGVYFTLNKETRVNNLFDVRAGKFPIIEKTSITQPILLYGTVGSSNPRNELNPRHSIYAGRSNIYVAVVPKDTKAPSRYAILKISTSPINESYNVIGKFDVVLSTSTRKYGSTTVTNPQTLNTNAIIVSAPNIFTLQGVGGGVYEPTIEIVDFGAGYAPSSFSSGFSLIELNSSASNYSFLSDSRNREISVSTRNFLPTLVSKQLGVATRPSSGTIQYYIADGGFGYIGNAFISAGQTSGVTSVVSVSLLTQPKGYSPGEYILTTQEPPSGTTATVVMVIPTSNGNPYVYVQNAGSGYTSIPTITAPEPNILSGNVNFAYITNTPNGYSIDNKHYFSVQSSPSQGGSAVIYMQNNQAYIESQGFGYTTAPIVTAPAPDISITCSGYISSIRVSTRGLGYQDALVLPLDVQPSPVSGGNAQASFYFQGDDCFVTIDNPGYGYTTSPVVTAPQPNISASCFGIVNVYLKSAGSGYYDNSDYYLQFTPPPTGGVAPIVRFRQSEGFQPVTEFIGYGYSTAPAAQSPLPDFKQSIFEQGFVSNLGLTNNPVGYENGTYSLTVASSPSSGGTAIVSLIVSDDSYGFSIQNKGYGYVTAPFITAPTPNALQGKLASISITTIGRGYTPSTTYDCIVDSAPSSGQTAQVQFYSSNPDSGEFIIVNQGYGYTSSPNISVPTPQGSIISSITIVCGGSFYTRSTASYSISDASGTGYSLGEIVLSAGAVQSIQVIDGGRGFGGSPKINFSIPTRPILPSYPADVIPAEFNITTASANAILSTSSQRDILMEVFETDGTDEQVIAQATVSLAKRVLE